MMRAMALGIAVAIGAGSAAQAADPVRLLAAGSLRAALTDVAEAWTSTSGGAVSADFAPSGLLRDRILGGEAADVFASANLEHPQAIAAERGGEVRAFARNTLCALAQPGLAVESETLLETMLRAEMRVGTSTPVADPSGNYAFELFDRAEALSSGASASLKAKALQLTGGPDSVPAPEGRNLYAWVMQEDRADLFLTYCTNAVLAVAEAPDLQIIQIPDTLNVGAEYGLIVLSDTEEARGFAAFILSADGQAILARFGFGSPG
jgi:molybdate transport system substrate-binding protein